MLSTVIIGAGGIADKHVKSLNRIPDVRVIGVIDPNPANAKKIAQQCGAPIIDDLNQVIDDADMIHLLTPPSKRVDYARLAMEKGRHVFCEKPVAVTLADAKILHDLALKNKVKFMTAFNMRFRPGYKILQDAVLSGKLGDIISVWIHRTGPGSGFKSSLGDSWRTDADLACGMTIESLSHDIDMIRGLGLEISGVSANTLASRADLPQFDNNTQAFMTLRGGGQVNICASWSSHLPFASRGVIGTRGTAIIEGSGFFDFTKFRMLCDDMEYEQVLKVNDPFDIESYYSENLHFINCLKNGREPEVTAENGLKALEISLAMLRSDREKRVIDL